MKHLYDYIVILHILTKHNYTMSSDGSVMKSDVVTVKQCGKQHLPDYSEACRLPKYQDGMFVLRNTSLYPPRNSRSISKARKKKKRSNSPRCSFIKPSIQSNTVSVVFPILLPIYGCGPSHSPMLR